MGEISSFQMGVIGALFLSVASSVSIVICNKALMSNLGFPFATTLTSWHLLVTFCTLHVAHRFNLFESKPIDMKTVMLFGILNGVSIGLLNLTLGFNSIGFYQSLNSGSSFFLADDQACNHTLHSTVGNHLPKEAIQVLSSFPFHHF
ncbi:hypothetical protein GQ457_16G011520 [Hibiscus cannabinus]